MDYSAGLLGSTVWQKGGSALEAVLSLSETAGSGKEKYTARPSAQVYVLWRAIGKRARARLAVAVLGQPTHLPATVQAF